METGYPEFRKKVMTLTGWDLNCYKSQQLERRLKALMVRTKVDSLAQYALLLERDPSRVRELSDVLTINVSEFFRNPERFQYLETRVLKSLPSATPQVWSAGCANGSEPYTLAMLMQDAGIKDYSILATDIDLNILDVARKAAYAAKEIAGVPGERRGRHFSINGDTYKASDSLRSRIKFRRHNLLSDSYPYNFDLIVCRNVLIYFTEEAKNSVITRFHASLKPGGYLFVGSTETIFNSADIGFVSVAPFFYQKPAPR